MSFQLQSALHTFAQMGAPQMPELPPGPSLDTLRGPVELPRYELWQIIGASAFAAVALIIFIYIIARYFWLNAQDKQQSIAADKASLSAIHLASEEPNDAEFAAALTNSIRSYLATTLTIPIRGRTNEQILAQLPEEFPVATGKIQNFFNLCDQAKFAQTPLSPTQRKSLSDTAQECIQAVEALRTQKPEDQKKAQ